MEKTHLIVSDAPRAHGIGTNLTFPRSSRGSYLRATRPLAGTVGATKGQRDMGETNLLRQLRHPVPPPPQEVPPPRNICVTGTHDSNDAGTVTVLEPTPFPPFSSVLLGETKFVGKTPCRSKCRVGTPLAVAAPTPGLLKHGKEVGNNYFHISLAHAHTSVPKVVVKQHGFHLTGELILYSAWSRAKGNRAPTPYHATSRATQPLELAHLDTAGPCPVECRVL